MLMLANAPYAYALHEIMLDDKGKPYDYRYIEVNEAFSQLTGIPANIAGKTVTELLPGIRSGSFDWVEYYGKIALEGGHETFEQYSEPLEKWYKVHVQSSEKLIFSTIFTDITYEKELKAYQKRLTLAQSLTNAGTWEYDIKKQTLFWSPECEKLFGVKERTFKGSFNDFLKRVHPDDRQYVIEVNKPITELKEGIPLHYTHRIKRDDGEVRWVRESAGVTNDADGKPAKIIGFVYDITEQKDNEIILEREEKLRQIVNNIDGAFWLMSADREEILYLSPSFETIFGRPIESLRDSFEAYLEIIHEEDREESIKAYVEFQKTGKYFQDYRIRRPDGSIRWVHSKAFPVKNQQGNIVRYAGIITDITDRKRMERETLEAKRHAEANQRRFEQIAEHTGEFVWEVDKDGIYTYANLAVEKILGYKPEELAGKIKCFDLLPENQKTKTIEEISKTIENKEPIRNLENVMISKSGQEVHVITNGIPVLDADGELIGYRGSDRDVTDRKRAEDALKKSEEKYKRLSYNLHAGIVVHDADTNIVFCNKEASNLLGLPAEQLYGRDAAHPEWHFLNEQGEKLLTDEYPVNVVFSTNKPLQNKTFGIAHPEQGSVKWLLVNAYPEHDQDGQIEQVVVTFINITKIKETEEKLQIIANNTYNWEFWENPEGELVYHSPACREITGHGPDELIQNIDLFLDRIHPEDKPGYLNHHKDARSVLKKRSHNFRLITADGQTRHIEHLCKPVFDEQNNFLGVRGTNVDITERIEAREKLIESELFANAIVESTPALLYIYDLEKNQNVWVNEYHKLFFEGISLESTQFKKDDITQLTHPDDFEKLQSKVMLLDSNPNIDKAETEIRIMYKGAWKWFSVLISVFKTNEQGKPAQLLGALIDIDDHKQAEEELKDAKEKAEEASRLKTAFIDNISHEIRTPLNGIVGFGQLIAQANITREERVSYFNVLQQSTDRLIQTVTDFMDISKIASGNMRVNKREFLIDELLEEQLQVLKRLCASKGVNVNLEIPDGFNRLIIYSDDELLSKVLAHLLGNAAKFTDKGSIAFGFNVKERFLEFFIKDQGKGIAKDKLENIFEAFEQEDTAMTRGHEGSGLGLAIAKGIVQLLGGEIWAKSVKGAGSVFFFTIPYEGKNQMDETLVPAAPSVKTLEDPLILLAEDDESNMAYTDILLKNAGFRTLQAKDGKEAVSLCKTNPDISLVLMDIKMPVLNGLEATRMIKEFRKDLPVIAVTAYVKIGDEHLIWEAGCEDYCFKPFSREDIISLISKYVGTANISS